MKPPPTPLSPTSFSHFVLMYFIGYGAKVHHGNKDARKERQEKELRRKWLLFLAGLLASIPAFFIAMVVPLIPVISDYFAYEFYPGFSVDTLVLLILATPVQFVLGAKFYVGAYKSLRHGVANMDVLIVLGTTAAYGYSVISIVLNVVLHYHVMHFFETSILLITFVFLGSYLETYAKGKTSEVRRAKISRVMGFSDLSFSFLPGHLQADVSSRIQGDHCGDCTEWPDPQRNGG